MLATRAVAEHRGRVDLGCRRASAQVHGCRVRPNGDLELKAHSLVYRVEHEVARLIAVAGYCRPPRQW